MKGPIEDGWISYRDEVIKPKPSDGPKMPAVLELFRKAFYSGAMFCHALAMKGVDDPEDQAIADMAEVEDNLHAFFNETVNEAAAKLGKELGI